MTPDPSGVPETRTDTGAQGLPAIEVRRAGEKGLGVFAPRAIRPGQLIEKATVIVLSPEETKLITRTVLKKYYFEWGKKDGDSALVLGCGFLYNHSYRPNADYYRGYDEQVIFFVAAADIAEGEEITINYNGFVDDQSALDFKVLP